MIEEVIALIINSTGNQNIAWAITDEMEDDDDDDEDEEEDKQDEKYDIQNENEEIWHLMKYKLKMTDTRCNLFKLRQASNSNKNRKIQIKHIQSLWHELVKRIDGEMSQYEDKCLFCLNNLLSKSETPIKVECCSLSMHYECLKKYIKSGFGNNGTRITLQQLSCPLCRYPMKNEKANDLFKETEILYDKVKEIAMQQLESDGKLNDPEVTNKNGAFYNNREGYAMKLYAFFLCYKCKEPYCFGSNNCGDNEEKYEGDITRRLCEKCERERKKQRELIEKENEKKYESWRKEKDVKSCPKCGKHIEKNGGCDHMTCLCGTHWCWICGKEQNESTIYQHISTHKE